MEDSDYLCELFNKGEWKNLNKTGFFENSYYNPKDIVFQHMSVKENVTIVKIDTKKSIVSEMVI